MTEVDAGRKTTGVDGKVVVTASDGRALHHDLADVQVDQFQDGPAKPLIYESGPQTIRQGAVHRMGKNGGSH